MNIHLIAIGLLASSTFMHMASAAEPLESRLKSIDNLIERSSVARQVVASANPEATAKREDARRLYQEALRARESGDEILANKLLGQSSLAMMTAAKLAKDNNAVSDKDRQDYENDAASLVSMLEAQQRIAREKGRGGEASDLAGKVGALRDEASGLAAKQHYREARILVSMGLEKTKASLEAMKGGTTESVLLNFTTPAEWYDYYQAKVDSQMSAVEMLGGRFQGSGKGRMIDSLLIDAKEKRTQANNLAASGNHEQANAIMEKLLGRLMGGLMSVMN